MKISVLILFLALLTIACKTSNKGETAEDAVTKTADSIQAPVQFFPVAAFLKNEMDYVDSLPVGIKKYQTRGIRTDSAYIKADEFHQLASEFLSNDLEDSAFRKSYAESSFLDRSTNNATFFYKALRPTSAIQRIDVVTAKGEVYDEVKSIYMEKTVQQGVNSIRKKMFWKPKRSFQIISLTEDTGSGTNAEIVKVVWDNRE